MDQPTPQRTKRKYRTKEEKRTLIKEQITSGLTVVDYCVSKDIYPTQFYSWKRQLDATEKNDRGTSRFVELTLPTSNAKVELFFPNGVKLQLVDNALPSPELIKTLLSAT